jgi:hypothetical protein
LDADHDSLRIGAEIFEFDAGVEIPIDLLLNAIKWERDWNQENGFTSADLRLDRAGNRLDRLSEPELWIVQKGS